jgi:hypothetical protein
VQWQSQPSAIAKPIEYHDKANRVHGKVNPEPWQSHSSIVVPANRTHECPDEAMGDMVSQPSVTMSQSSAMLSPSIVAATQSSAMLSPSSVMTSQSRDDPIIKCRNESIECRDPSQSSAMVMAAVQNGGPGDAVLLVGFAFGPLDCHLREMEFDINRSVGWPGYRLARPWHWLTAIMTLAECNCDTGRVRSWH